MAKETTSGGVGFMGLLFIAFLVLKLCHVIDWSWWWVTAPLWMPFTLVLLMCAFVVLCMVFAAAFNRR